MRWGWRAAAAWVVLGLALATVREGAAESAVQEIGRGDVLRFLAQSHAGTATGVAGWSAAVVLTLVGVAARSGLRAPALSAWCAAAALGGLGALVGSPWIGLAGLGVLAGAAVDAPSAGFAAAAASFATAWCLGEAGLYQALASSPGDAERWWMVRGHVLTVATAWACWEVVRGAWRWGPALGVIGALALAGGTWGVAASSVLRWAPSELTRRDASLAMSLPAGSERFLGGCVWRRGEAGWERTTAGRVSPRHGIEGCAEEGGLPSVSRRPSLQDRPTLLLSPDTPVADLVEHGVGEAHVLGVLSGVSPAVGQGWQWAVVPVQHLDPEVRQWRPLPGAVVVPEAAADVSRLVDGAPLRLDVVFLAEGGFTLGQVVERCAQVRQVHEGGVRCAVGRGPAERWR